MKIAIGADSAGKPLLDVIAEHLAGKTGIAVSDLSQPGYYAELSATLAKSILTGENDRGILICGTGLGMAMIANKVEGIFAGVCHDVYSAERLSKSNDAQILTLGARVVGSELAKSVVSAWMNSEFQGGGSTPKVARMRALEKIERNVSKATE